MKRGSTMLFVSYLRLSKKLLLQNQYGIDGQRQKINQYLSGLGGENIIIHEFIEYETGSSKRKCPQLKAALQKCKDTGATLITWKIDRLGRNLNQITEILDSGVPFIASETPSLDKFGLQILGAVAEKELEDISNRIRSALHVAKASGVKLGADSEQAKKLANLSAKSRRKQADEFAMGIYNKIQKIEKHSTKKYNNTQMADALNRRRIFTRNGCLWYSHQIARVKSRAKHLLNPGEHHDR
jgi:DNA invertase Pin-like site-specific DNA recombinase